MPSSDFDQNILMNSVELLLRMAISDYKNILTSFTQYNGIAMDTHEKLTTTGSMNDIAKRQVLHAIDMEDKKIEVELENEYKSCCGGNTDRRLLQFYSQLAFSLITVIFSVTKLALSTSCDQDSLYSGLLMMVIGTWLPSPRLSK